ncbi:MAG: tripartite tricarboxylate transporter TctB family protein [Caldimonas sp.]
MTSLRIKSQRDFWSGLMFVVAGVTFAVGATNYSMGTSARPGAGYFPLLLSAIMAILGAIVLFKSLVIETPGGDRIGNIAWKPLLVIIVAITVFGFMIEPLGMLAAVPAVVIIASLAGDEFHWKGVIANAAVLTFGSWAVFVFGLKLTIPVLPWFLQ